jgi:CheY-like chemotaxis protein
MIPIPGICLPKMDGWAVLSTLKADPNYGCGINPHRIDTIAGLCGANSSPKVVIAVKIF